MMLVLQLFYLGVRDVFGCGLLSKILKLHGMLHLSTEMINQ